MQPDSEGFLQPVIDKAKCVHCGKCERVCPVLHHGKARTPLEIYAAKAKDDKLRAGSASGGIFTLLALDVLNRGGVVFGAGFERSTWRVIHKAAHNEEELDDLRGSKYVQSDIRNTYQEAKQLLDNGTEVLYSGCPCQIAGLLNFLGKPYHNLITVDLICHGVPSPLAWRRYLDDREHEAGAKITRTLARRYCGWQEFALSFEFSNGKAYSENLQADPYIVSFLRNWSLRLCCYKCPFKNLKSNADITMGDDWGSEDKYSDGESIVLATTQAGEVALKQNGSSMLIASRTFNYVTSTNSAIIQSANFSRLRKKFFPNIQQQHFDAGVQATLEIRESSFVTHLAWWLKRLLINGEVNAL